MKNADSHIYLYAKGYYRKGDLIKDLKRIFGKKNTIDPEHITDNDIICSLLKIVWPYIRDQYHFMDFIHVLHPLSYWKLDSGSYTPEKAVIYKCLSILRNVRVEYGHIAFIEIDDPDPDILPLTKHTDKKGGQMNKTTNTTNVFKFRAEGLCDVEELKKLLIGKMSKVVIAQELPFPDVVMEMETTETLDAIKQAMQKVSDGHVMLQTIAPKDEYTGERRYHEK